MRPSRRVLSVLVYIRGGVWFSGQRCSRITSTAARKRGGRQKPLKFSGSNQRGRLQSLGPHREDPEPLDLFSSRGVSKLPKTTVEQTRRLSEVPANARAGRRMVQFFPLGSAHPRHLSFCDSAQLRLCCSATTIPAQNGLIQCTSAARRRPFKG